jgi:hypothetical protein
MSTDVKRVVLVVGVALAALGAVRAQDVALVEPPQDPPAIQAGLTEDGTVAMWADLLAIGHAPAVEDAPLLAKPFVAVWEGGRTLAEQAIMDPGETLTWIAVGYASVRAAQGELDDDLKGLAETVGLREEDDDDSGDDEGDGGGAAAGDGGASAEAPPGGTATSINLDLSDIDAPVTINLNTGNPVTTGVPLE